MRSTLCALVALAGLARAAEPLEVVPMKMDPEQVAHMLLQQPPAFKDCFSVLSGVCEYWSGDPDISLRWVQLDDDPEPEAILTTKGPGGGYLGYVFDHRGGVWNKIGPFMFFREYEGNDLFRVKKLTEDSPTVLLFTRDLGGSANTIVTTTAYQLREGKLWPVFEVIPMLWWGLVPERIEHSKVLASKDRLVIHTAEEVEKKVTNSCEVQRWDANAHEFVPAPADRTAYCDLKTGKPIPGKAYASGIPVFPLETR